MQNLQQNPGVLKWVNSTGSAVSSGDVVDLGGRVGIAVTDIAANATGAVVVIGIYRLSKTASETYSVGDNIFWSVANSKLTNTPAAGDPRFGAITKAAGASDAYGEAEINVAATAGPGTLISSGDGSTAQNAAAIRSILTLLADTGIMSK